MTHERLREMMKRTPREPAAVALVTGATRGIGEAFVRALPPETRLVVTGRDTGRLELLRAEFGERVVETVTADLSTADGVAAVAEAGERAGVDLLVNNAGLGRYGEFLSTAFDDHRTTVRVDVEAALELTHRLVPGMIARAEVSDRRAGVINVASSAAFVPVPTLATYAAAKAFLLSFTESFAAELAGQPIDVLCACPGATKTEFGERAGFRAGSMPGAMAPDRVARDALAALGRQTTVLIGPVSVGFTPVAVARSLFGQAFMRASRVMERVSDRG